MNMTFTTVLLDSDRNEVRIKHFKRLVMRRVRLVLFEPTRDGETEIVLLTNLSPKSVSASKGCQLYRGRWGIEAAEQLSWYYAYTEVNRVWTGMEIVLPYEYWSKKFDNMTPRQYATYIKSLAESIDVDKFQKKTRGQKKKVKKKFDPKVNHVSTFRILNDRK